MLRAAAAALARRRPLAPWAACTSSQCSLTRGLAGGATHALATAGLTDDTADVWRLASDFAAAELAPRSGDWDEKKVGAVGGMEGGGRRRGSACGVSVGVGLSALGGFGRPASPLITSRPQPASLSPQFFPVDVIQRAAGLGFGAMCVSPDHGGSGLTRSAAAAAYEALANGDVPVTVREGGGVRVARTAGATDRGCLDPPPSHCQPFPSSPAPPQAYLSIHNMVASAIDRHGTPSQRAALLPRLASGSALGAYCLTEPGAGSDAAALRTAAVEDGGEWVLTGEKAGGKEGWERRRATWQAGGGRGGVGTPHHAAPRRPTPPTHPPPSCRPSSRGRGWPTSTWSWPARGPRALGA